MLSRFGVLSRFSPTVTRGLAWRTARPLSTGALLASNGTDTAPQVLPKKGGGLSAFLHEKTGVTGAWMLGAGLTATLLSKEIYILNAETVVAVLMGGVIYWLVKKIGPSTAEYLDDRAQGILDQFNESRVAKTSYLAETIATEGNTEKMLECRHDVFEILKENNAMRLEEEYRRRLHEVNKEVKRRLDYQVDVDSLHRKLEQDQMVEWLEKAVTDTVMSKQGESLTQCMADLKQMATA